jgi:PPOX class probable F420-dependent enzyme
MVTISERYLDILQSTALAYIATIGPEGEPQVSPVLFYWNGTHILISMNKGRQKYRNMQRESRVAVSIVDPADFIRALEIRGTVIRIDEDADYHFLNLMSQKYLNRDATPEEAGPGEDRAVIVIEPQRLLPFPLEIDKR